ncbi:MAG: hypothetical protein IKK32_04800 [Oscillospiraceae bacterium]|nr:hypothetical protein [Oscillospiraceae bacterium]
MKKKIFAVLFSAIMMMSLATVSVSAVDNGDEVHPGKPHIVEYRRYDDTHHYKVCVIEGCNYKTSKQDCRGGQASCHYKAVCDVCKTEYGDYIHSYFYRTSKDYLTHTITCNVTGCEYSEKEYCVYKDGVCKLCSRKQPEIDVLDGVNDILNKKAGEVVLLYPDGTIVPMEYFEAAIKKKVGFYVDYAEYEWEISNVTLARNMDLSVKSGMDFVVEQSLLKSLKGENASVIQTEHEGEFGFDGTLTYKINKKYGNKYLNLYYYDCEARKVTYKGSTRVGAYGYLYLPLTHGGTYILNITDAPVSSKKLELVSNGSAVIGDLSAGESIKVEEIVL